MTSICLLLGVSLQLLWNFSTTNGLSCYFCYGSSQCESHSAWVEKTCDGSSYCATVQQKGKIFARSCGDAGKYGRTGRATGSEEKLYLEPEDRGADVGAMEHADENIEKFSRYIRFCGTDLCNDDEADTGAPCSASSLLPNKTITLVLAFFAAILQNFV